MVVVRGEIGPAAIDEVLPVSSSSVATAVLTAAEVFRLLDSPSPRVRQMGVTMLSAQPSADAFDWLCTCLDDPDARVRLAVTMALRRRGPEAGEVLRRMERDADPRVRQVALNAHLGAAALVG